MEGKYAMEAGCATQAQRPEYEYEGAARAWTQARERKDNAQAALARAEDEMNAAKQHEAESWERLSMLADRHPKVAAMASAQCYPTNRPIAGMPGRQ